jgi:predicted membrane protein
VDETTDSKEDYINSTSIFGGTKKNILSKNFKGGNITNVFGGTEIHLGQADIQGTAVIETTTIFGGTKLIIPSNWTVKSQAAVIFGGVEDKRAVVPTPDASEKILVLKGTVMFGGIDIRSY